MRRQPACRSLAAVLAVVVCATVAHSTVRRESEQRRTRSFGRAPERMGALLGGPDTVLSPAEVTQIVTAAANAVNNPNMTIAVVDRAGNILALFRKAGAVPGVYDDIAVGLGRTTAFFSNSRAPLSSRTVRFISNRNFPPGVVNTPAGGLYGVENTNRGCDLGVTFNPGQAIVPSRSVDGLRPANLLQCNSTVRNGCGTGIVTGKFSNYLGGVPPDAELEDRDPTAVNPGGVPIFRRPASDPENRLLGGIGVAGPGVSGPEAEFAAFVGAASGTNTFPVFEFPLPTPGNVFIEGIRLPFVKQVTQPPGTAADPGGFAGGAFDPDFGPLLGKQAPIGYLVGPIADPDLTNPGRLTLAEVQQIVRQAFDSANRTRAQVRLPVGFCSRMIITVVNLNGTVLAHYRMKDALFDAADVVPAKARNVVYYSSAAGNAELGLPAGTAVTNRAIGFGGQPLYPSGILLGPPGPFFNLYKNEVGNLTTKSGYCQQGGDPRLPNKNGVIFFAGSVPLYRNGVLIGGLGVSGDGLEQDDYVANQGAAGFLPDQSIRINNFLTLGERIPFYKFPRSPEACDPTRSPDIFLP